MDFKQAIQWLKEGKKVRRKNWAPDFRLNIPYTFGICAERNNAIVNEPFSYDFKIEDFEATDWEIYEEEKSLSDQECNVLINTINIETISPSISSTTMGSLKKIKINIPGEELRFKKGFLKEDAKECFDEIKNQVRGYSSLSPKKIIEIINKNIGPKLI